MNDENHDLGPQIVEAWLKGWGESPRSLLVESHDDPAAGVEFHHNGYAYRVKGREIRLRRLTRSEEPYGARKVDGPFPNIEVVEGCVSFPIEDIIEMALRAADDGTLSRILFENQQVRREFIDSIGDSYGALSVSNPERRRLLHRMQSDVHDAALDRACTILADIERKLTHVWASRQYEEQANNVLSAHADNLWRAYQKAQKENRALTDPLEPEKVHRLSPEPDIPSHGKTYEEVRAYWRDRLEERFAPPSEDA